MTARGEGPRRRFPGERPWACRFVQLGSGPALVAYGNVGYGLYSVTRGGPSEDREGLVLSLGLGLDLGPG